MAKKNGDIFLMLRIMLMFIGVFPIGFAFIFLLSLMDFPLRPYVFYEAWMIGLIILVISWFATNLLGVVLKKLRDGLDDAKNEKPTRQY